MEEKMIVLWTFENEEKLNKFKDILKNNDIEYEIQSKNKQDSKDSGLVIAVIKNDYVKAKKLLMRHRKRKTSADYH